MFFTGLNLVSNSLFLTNPLTVSIHFSSNPFTASKPVRIIIFPPKRAFVQILRFRILWSFAESFFSFLSSFSLFSSKAMELKSSLFQFPKSKKFIVRVARRKKQYREVAWGANMAYAILFLLISLF